MRGSDELALEATLAPSSPCVYVDPERLSEVLANLLANALRLEGGGTAVDGGAGRRGDAGTARAM